jgi:superfamily II DNA or RNA helicase
MTLGTGAVGLDLVSSSCIYLLEPQWNPSIEEQAIGRALRLGQVSQVRIVRYIMESTVEEVRYPPFFRDETPASSNSSRAMSYPASAKSASSQVVVSKSETRKISS